LALTGDVVSLQTIASDGQNNPLNYFADGLPEGLSIGTTTGMISSSVAGSADAYKVSVHVNDGTLIAMVNFNWTINPSNNAPQVTNPGGQISTDGYVISLQVSANDGEANTLHFTVDGLPPGLGIDPDTGLISGTVGGASVTPYSVSEHVSDGSLSSTVNFFWAVNSAIQPDGDVNEDGIVDVADLLLAQRALLGEITLTENQVLHVDVAPLQSGIPAPDGMFTLGDMLVIERKVLGLISF